MKQKRKLKQKPAVAEPTSQEMKERWLPALASLSLILPILFARLAATAEMRRDVTLPGWAWPVGVLGLTFWLFPIMMQLFQLDMKQRVVVTLYPGLLHRWPVRVKLANLIQILCFYPPLMAATHTLAYGYHAGFTAFASIYLGFGLFGLLAIVGRRRVWRRWLEGIGLDKGQTPINIIETIEEIEAEGLYALTKYPAWAIHVTQERRGCAIAVQLELFEEWFPLCNKRGEPILSRSLAKLVRELKKVEAEWDELLEEPYAQLRSSL